MDNMAISPVNYALNRPALQSSVSEWSSSKRPEEAARGANNGDLTVAFGCHTSDEERPWWQVDLGSETVIERIAIYNRLECAYRLRYFSLHASLDGREWKRFYKRTNPEIFGQVENDVFVVTLENIVIARFVRLQLDYRETLHFRECEVYGRLPSWDDYQKFGTKDDLLARQKALFAGRSGFITEIGDHSVFVDQAKYGSKVVSSILENKYEAEERQFTERMLLPPDRVLEVGTAIGVVTMVAADRTSPAQVRTFDGNPYIIEDAIRNFAFNRMEGIAATAGVLRNRKHLKQSEKTVKFSVLREFWASRIGITRSPMGVIEVVDVPVYCLEDEIAAHRANVLIIDIEGGEVDLLDGADLSSIRLIIMETHYWSAGVEATDSMIRQLICQGFNIDLSLSRWGVVVLSRNLDLHRKSKLRRWLGAQRRAVSRVLLNKKWEPVRPA